jgi:phosphoribosylformylglycinamidine synthase
VDVIRIGTVTADPSLIVEGSASISLAELRDAHDGWFPAYMAGEV